METQNCYHCGLEIVKKDEIIFDDKSFCCPGCKTVYEIFTQTALRSTTTTKKHPVPHHRTLAGSMTFWTMKPLQISYSTLRSSIPTLCRCTYRTSTVVLVSGYWKT
jgi:transposase-like protein